MALEFVIHARRRSRCAVQDEGTGFDPGRVADPVADENLLKADGRGIFFMRSFMDEVDVRVPARGRHGRADGEEASKGSV